MSEIPTALRLHQPPRFRPPRLVQKLVSPVAQRVLWSRAHGLLSQRVLLVTFTGRVSGKVFTTPALYEQAGETLLLRVSGTWWKNLRGGARVTLRLRGQSRTGTTEVFPAADGLVPVMVQLDG